MRKSERYLDMGWYIAIFLFMALPLSFAYVGYSRKINTYKLVIPIASMVLSFFMSCRAINVEADTKRYVYVFKQISNIRLLDVFKARVYGMRGV